MALRTELDELSSRLVAAEDARDKAERKVREMLRQESARIRRVERDVGSLGDRIVQLMSSTNPALVTRARHGREGREGPSSSSASLPTAQPTAGGSGVVGIRPKASVGGSITSTQPRGRLSRTVDVDERVLPSSQPQPHAHSTSSLLG